MTNQKIEISIKHIFEQLAMYLAYSKTHPIEEQKAGFVLQAQGIQMLFNGTYLCPMGTPLVKYKDYNIHLPEDWCNELDNKDYWPIWYTNEEVN